MKHNIFSRASSILITVIVGFLVARVHLAGAQDACDPQGVHLQYAAQPKTDSHEYTVIYYTREECADAWVFVNASRKDARTHNFTITQTIHYNDAQPESWNTSNQRYNFSVYIHYVNIFGLLEDASQKRTYSIHDPSSRAPARVYNFTVLPRKSDSATILFYADYDASEPSLETTNYLRRLVSTDPKTAPGAIVHIGDIAYDLFSHRGQDGLQFLQKVEDIAAQVPYMTSPGNHEYLDDYKYYRMFFPNPSGDQEVMYYSWDLGNVHLVSLVFEKEYTNDTTLRQKQLQWLKSDLANAATAQWIIAYAHTPLYCSMVNYYTHHCEDIRGQMNDYEEVLRAGGVDMLITGHIHMYERTFPVYRYAVQGFGNAFRDGGRTACYDAAVCSETSKTGKCDLFVNPEGIIHVVEGAPGNHYYFRDDQPPPNAWSVRSMGLRAVGVVHAVNGTHLKYSHVFTDTGEAVDYFTIVKDPTLKVRACDAVDDGQQNNNDTRKNKSAKETEKVLEYVAIGLLSLTVIVIVVIVLRKVIRSRRQVKLIVQEESASRDQSQQVRASKNSHEMEMGGVQDQKIQYVAHKDEN